jgi:hypothetical protein
MPPWVHSINQYFKIFQKCKSNVIYHPYTITTIKVNTFPLSKVHVPVFVLDTVIYGRVHCQVLIKSAWKNIWNKYEVTKYWYVLKTSTSNNNPTTRTLIIHEQNNITSVSVSSSPVEVFHTVSRFSGVLSTAARISCKSNRHNHTFQISIQNWWQMWFLCKFKIMYGCF